MTKAREMRIWTVRNLQGQLIGRYRAYTAEQAINRHRFIDEQAVTAATFRRSQPFTIRRSEFTASVEG